jgi:hypothetical protein
MRRSSRRLDRSCRCRGQICCVARVIVHREPRYLDLRPSRSARAQRAAHRGCKAKTLVDDNGIECQPALDRVPADAELLAPPPRCMLRTGRRCS